MRIYKKSFFVALFLCSVFMSGGAILTSAQNSWADKAVNKSLAQIVREKFPDKQFVLLTPDDLAKLLPNFDGNISAVGDPCNAAQPIDFGDTVNGQLTTADCQLEDGSYADFYMFNGTQGREIRISMVSGSFDTYLGLASEDGSFVVEDDDGGGGTDSQIVVTLPQTGVYIILANSAFPAQTGNYSLALYFTVPCTYVLQPTSANVPASGGTYTFSVTTQSDCRWNASVINAPFITTNSSGIGSGTVIYNVEVNPNETVRAGNIRVGNNNFLVNQSYAVCTFTITPATVNVSAAGTSGSFTVTTSATGCYWRADSNNLFISNSGGGGNSGSGTVNYTIATNNGAARTGTITVRDQIFTVNQAGQNCTFSISPTSITAPSAGQTGTVTVTTQGGCAWNVSRSQWILIDTLNATGSGTFSYTILPNNATVSRSAVIPIFGSSYRVEVTQTGTLFRKTFDFDGDGKTDISIYRPTVGQWWYARSSDSSYRASQFGNSTDKIVPADYTGDGKTDLAVWRESTGEWFILRSEDASFYSFPFGASGDIPAPADFDGDGKADPAIFRPSTATWYIIRSSDGGTMIQQFGANGDRPVAADYDGDGKTDLAIFRPSDGTWWINRSQSQTTIVFSFGTSTDKTVQADYTGDGKTDVAFWRPTTGEWFILRSEDSSFYSAPFGAIGDIPSPGEYDGDGRADLAVFRPSVNTWYINRTTAGIQIQGFGAEGDQPVPNAFVR